MSKYTPVKQALILSGGRGTRMSKEFNPDSCKSLIKYNGKEMISYLVDSLIEGGITDFVFATNNHSDLAVKEIITEKGIKNFTVVVSDGKYRGVPYEIRDYLEDRFLMVCGHHPVSSEHVRKMIVSSKEHENVMSVYDNSIYTMDKDKRIIKDGEGLRFIDLKLEKIGENHLYVRNPYILNKKIIESVHNDNYTQTFSYYIFKNSLLGEKIGLVEADMPPEFDYDSEFIRTVKYLG